MAKSDLIVAVLLFCSACSSHSALMTYAEYAELPVGTTVTEVETKIGQPYAVRKQKDGTEEYEYIERIDSGNNIVAENHYFLIVREGKVIGKRMNRQKPPAYDLIYQEEPNYPSNP
jgi:outer membrane protein assembly factor BamE (lipoprotein component of BamABCDE complex)